MYAIKVHNLSKTYKNGIQALSGLNIQVKSGEIYSLLGENGAGKSTLIKILTTFLKPTSGNITMLGKDIQQNSIYIRSNIACVSQQTSIDTNLSLEENMMFQAELYKIPKAEAKKRMAKLIKDFELTSYLKYPISLYSGGIKRRLDIAMNMITNPKILFLDEPTVGMDIQSRKMMWDMVRKIRNEFGTTIFLTTHYLEEADNLSDTVCIMKEGKEIIQGSPSQLKHYLRQNNIEIKLVSDLDVKAVLEFSQKCQYVDNVEIEKTMLTVTAKEAEETFNKLTIYLIDNNIPFYGIAIVEPTLENVFLRLTKRSNLYERINYIKKNIKWRFSHAFTIVITILQPILWLVLYGTVAQESMQLSGINNYTAFIFSGLIILVSFSTCGSSGIMNYMMKSNGSFYRILIAPIKRSSIILGQAFEAILCSFLEIFIMSMIGLLFSVNIFQNLTGLFIIILLVFLSAFLCLQ